MRHRHCGEKSVAHEDKQDVEGLVPPVESCGIVVERLVTIHLPNAGVLVHLGAESVWRVLLLEIGVERFVWKLDRCKSVSVNRRRYTRTHKRKHARGITA